VLENKPCWEISPAGFVCVILMTKSQTRRFEEAHNYEGFNSSFKPSFSFIYVFVKKGRLRARFIILGRKNLCADRKVQISSSLFFNAPFAGNVVLL